MSSLIDYDTDEYVEIILLISKILLNPKTANLLNRRLLFFEIVHTVLAIVSLEENPA